MGTRNTGSDPLRELVARYMNEGDDAAIEELVRRTRPKLLAAARRIGRPGDAEDAVQVAYLSLVRHRDKPIDAPLAWLLTATVRLAYRKKATHARQHRIAQALANTPTKTASVPDASVGETRAIVREQIAALPDRYRDVLFLHSIVGLSIQDVAVLMDVPAPTVRTQLFRARALLEGRLSPRVRHALSAIPWWLADQSVGAMAALGGMFMAKQTTTALVGVVVLLGAIGSTWLVQTSGPTGETAKAPSESAMVAKEDAKAQDSAAPSAVTLEPTSTASNDKPAIEQGKRAPFGGRVMTPGGVPVAGAAVETIALWNLGRNGRERVYSRLSYDGWNSATASDGTFSIAHESLGRVSSIDARVSATGFPLTVVRLQRDERKDITLGQGGRLSVSVHDPEGRPVSGASIGVVRARDIVDMSTTAKLYPIHTLTTDHAGRAQVLTQNDTYRLEVKARGFPPVLTGEVTHSESHPLTQRVELEKGSVAHVRVVDGNNEPLEGARVLIGAPWGEVSEAITSEDGIVTSTPLPTTLRNLDGSARTAAEERGLRLVFFFVTAEGYAPLGGRRSLPRTAETMEIQVRMIKGMHVAVRVVDDAGDPIEGTTVGVDFGHNSYNPLPPLYNMKFTTDASGRADLGVLRASQNRIFANGPATSGRRTHEWFHKNVDFPENGELKIVLRRKGATIRGRALGPMGNPIKGMRVRWGANEMAFTEAPRKAGPDGHFELNNQTRGAGLLELTAPGYARRLIAFDIGAGSEATAVEARLLDDGRIAGVVVHRDESPAPDIPIQLMQRLEIEGRTQLLNITKTTSDSKGSFQFLGVPVNDVFLVAPASPSWIASNAHSLRHIMRGDHDVRIVVKPLNEGLGINLRADVTLNGRAYEGPLSVEYMHGKTRWLTTEQSDNDSRTRMFKIGTGPGTYTFNFVAPGILPYQTSPIKVDDTKDGARVNVILDLGETIELRVLLDEEPLRNTNISVYSKSAIRGANHDLITNDDGICVLGGFIASERPTLVINRKGDRFSKALLNDVAPPTQIDVTLRRTGNLTVSGPITFGEMNDYITATLYDPHGKTIKKNTIKTRSEKWAKYAISSYFEIYEPGTYRVEMVIGERIYEAEIAASLGQSLKCTMKEAK